MTERSVIINRQKDSRDETPCQLFLAGILFFPAIAEKEVTLACVGVTTPSRGVECFSPDATG
jgi:hypothetical protein